MSQFVRTRIRCKIEPAKVGTAFLATTGDTPKFFKSTGIEFELAFFNGVDLFDVTNIASVTVHVKVRNDPTSAPLMLKTVQAAQINTLLRKQDWDDGSNQHVLVSFLGSETGLPAGTYDVTVSGVTNDDTADADVFGTSVIQVIDAGISNLITPPVVPAQGITLADIQGLLAGFAKKVMGPGETITFRSANGVVNRIMGAGDNGTAGNPDPQRVDSIEIVG